MTWNNDLDSAPHFTVIWMKVETPSGGTETRSGHRLGDYWFSTYAVAGRVIGWRNPDERYHSHIADAAYLSLAKILDDTQLAALHNFLRAIYFPVITQEPQS